MSHAFHLWLAWGGGALLLLVEMALLWRRSRTNAPGEPDEP